MNSSRALPIGVAVCLMLFALEPSQPASCADLLNADLSPAASGAAVGFQVSLPARDLPVSVSAPVNFHPSRLGHPATEPSQGSTWDRSSLPLDPLSLLIGPALTPPVDLNIEGVGNPQGCGGCSPPDTNGDAGLNHYLQMVNATKVAVFDKNGVLLAPPFDMGKLWPTGAVCTEDAGDPIVEYDRMSDRWVLSQFADPHDMCFAISQTSDPLGPYFLYTFDVGEFPDYEKVGVWPDAYLLGSNESTYTAYAFNRAKMLAGDQTANFVKFTGQTNFLLPSNFTGPNAPPAGSPGYFYTFKNNTFPGGAGDRIELFALAADFTNPTQSTFTMVATMPITPFTYTVCGAFNFDCADQPGTTRKLDVVSEWPMHRFPYRNFSDHQTLLGDFTVGGGTGEVGAAIRWFELRNTGSGWNLFQEGTFDPGDGNDRFMGSVSMDGLGDIALGFTVSSSMTFPSIRYATRSPNDPSGTLSAEAALINGGGSQTNSDRWGDYSAMAIDPTDDCSFWYTNEYYPTNSPNQWHTRVGRFKGPTCPGGGNQPPVAEANGPYSGQRRVPICFSSAGSTAPGGIIKSFSWNFGDGSSPNGRANPCHAYRAVGDFTAQLTVTDNLGAAASDAAAVTVLRGGVGR